MLNLSPPPVTLPANLRLATGVINTTERAVVSINDSISSVNLILTGDGNVGEFTDGEPIATIDESVLDEVQDGRDALTAASETTEESRVQVAE